VSSGSSGDKLWNPRIIELEGMAMTGQLVNVKMESCDRPPGWKKLIVETVDGKHMSTNCMEPDAAKRNFMVFTLYIRNWSRLVTREYKDEELPTESYDTSPD